MKAELIAELCDDYPTGALEVRTELGSIWLVVDDGDPFTLVSDTDTETISKIIEAS